MEHEGRASGTGRRSSVRRSMARSIVSIKDDDDYDLSAIAVADGFRPADSSSSQTPSTSTSRPSIDTLPTHSSANTVTDPETDATHSIPQPPPSLANIPSKHGGFVNRPSSITKPHRPHDSLTLRNDGVNPAVAQPSAAATSGHLNSSPLMRVESPYRGPSGPSHPYQMYPQRALSNASTSTAGPAVPAVERSYDGPRGPTHPYTLYTQNTVPVEETREEHIPVGFHGMGNTYQRQIGPDGEEAGDLIGPLGHMEELPPYTRYPTAGFVNMASAGGNATDNTASSSPPPIAGAGGIGIATRNPEFSSTDEDLALSRSRPSVRSTRSEVSRHEINTAAREVTEKPAMSKWQRRAKKKMWGIVPYWAICLLVAALVIMGVVMGSVIGTLLSRHKPGKDDGDDGSFDPSRISGDIEPITTSPPELDPLRTGSFMLPHLDPSQAPKSCFKDPSQSQAWSCDIANRYYQLDIEPVADASETNDFELTISTISHTDANFIWGTQPPNIPHPLALTLVNDSYELSRGPAWWLNITYDKTVLVDEHSFSANSKRGWSSGDMANFDPDRFSSKPFRAAPGDKPWVCTWPETTLEIFFYPNQNSSAIYHPSPTTGYSTATATGTYGTATPTGPPPMAYDPMPPFPNVLKFLERRLSGRPESAAYCQQIEILEDGSSFKNVTDSHGKPCIVDIPEVSSSLVEALEQHQRSRHSRSWAPDLLATRALELTDCGCLWMSS